MGATKRNKNEARRHFSGEEEAIREENTVIQELEVAMPTSRYVTIERGEVYREKSELWVRMKPMDLNSVILAELVEGSVRPPDQRQRN
jgi:replication initiation and membrane attachment protein DnaB